MTAGDDCAVLVADGVLAGAAPGDLAGVPGAVHQAAGDGAVAQAGAAVGAATAGVTVGAVCIAGGDFQASDLEALSAANWTMSALKQRQTFRGAIASAK